MLRRRDPLIPPRRLLDQPGTGDFRAVGETFRGFFVDLAGLSPAANVLEIGCGVGRMAVPLTSYLSEGTYDGLDVAPAAIKWTRRAITRRYPNFRFHLADVYSDVYNPSGAWSAETYRFPFEDAAFDFVLLTSVFTHMLPAEVDRYLAEIRRVLRPTGTCFATWFITEAPVADGEEPMMSFEHPLGDGCRVHDADRPRAAVAYSQQVLEEMYAGSRLQISAIHYGFWAGRLDPTSFQDIVITRPE